MSYCINPSCQKPTNPDTVDYCQHCGSGLLLNHRFRPLKLIGEGGFGRTFQAVDEHSVDESKCVVKQFYPENQAQRLKSKINVTSQTRIIRGPQAIQNLQDIHRKEVEQLSRLKHPQIPTLITHFEQDGYLYLVQEFIDGENLDTELKRQGAFSEAQIWQVLKELLPVIKYINDQHIIHRDIKPENIIRPLNNKPLVLVDFGAAKLVAPQSVSGQFRKTAKTGKTVIGTANFMAPEQEKGREVFASDLYSLGVTCICLLTNASPVKLFDDGSNSWEWRSRSKKVSDKLGKILDNLLELGTAKRYKSADEVIQDIALQSPRGSSNASGKKKPQVTIWHKIASLGAGAQGFAALVSLLIALGLIKVFSPSTLTDILSQVPLASERGLNYSQLREYLRQKNWQAADADTYEVLLKIAGEKSQSRGYINYDEIKSMPCTELKTIDDLWRKASDGKLGFSAQQLIYQQQGQNWQKMYDQVGWGSLISGIFSKTVEQEFNWQTRRFQYKSGMEPKFQNPPAGHLPVIASLVRGNAFPQFAEICKF